MIFADTNWVLALLVPGADAGRAREAQGFMGRMNQPAMLSPLVRHELRGVLIRLAKRPDPPAWRAFTAAPEAYTVAEVDWPALLARGAELQQRFGPAMMLGALDALHLAAAEQVEARHFCSFDGELRLCAEALGFRVVPKLTDKEKGRAKGL